MEKENTTNDPNTSLNVLYTETVADSAARIFSEPANVVIVLLSLVGLVANFLTVVAAIHIPGKQTTHSKLIISLSIADMCISLSVFLHVFEKVTVRPLHAQEFCIEVANEGFLNFALLATLINLFAMGIDHYIAIKKPLHYHLIMSRPHATIMLLVIWILSLIGGFLDVIIGAILNTKKDSDFCLHVYVDNFEARIPILCLIIIEMIVLIYLYCHIFHKVRSSTCQFRDRAKGVRRRRSETSNMHSRKAIITTLLIVGTFMVCWVPNSIFRISVFIMLQMHWDLSGLLDFFFLVQNILWMLILSNSLCDPLIYALRLAVIQKGYKRLINKIFKPCCGTKTVDHEISKRFSHRESARTFGSEVEMNIAEEIQQLETEIELSNASQASPRTYISQLDLNTPTDMREKILFMHSIIAEENTQSDNSTKLMSNNNNDLPSCEYQK